MFLNITAATIIYFSLGFILFQLIEPNNRLQNNVRYCTSFFVATISCFLFYIIYDLLGLPPHKGVPGLFGADSSTYYLDAVYLLNYGQIALSDIITDHYHEYNLALQLFIFGEHVLIPKIYQVLLFSLSVVLWTSVARDVFKNHRLEKYFFYLLLFCIPLLSYTAVVLKEISLFFATTIAVYGFCKYTYYNQKPMRYLLVTVSGLLLMFLFRRQFALIMMMSFLLTYIISGHYTLTKKLLFGVAVLGLVLLLNYAPFLKNIGATQPLTEGGSVFVGRGDTGRIVAEVGTTHRGIVGSAIYLISNPITVAPMLLYGLLMLFFHPPFLMFPSDMLAADHLGRVSLTYLTMGYYNAFFTLLIPALLFGAWHLYKTRKYDPFLLSLLLYFVLTSVAIIFASDSYRRFKISYFWPIAYLYVVFGISVFYKWKKYIPYLVLSGFFLGVMYMFRGLIIELVAI